MSHQSRRRRSYGRRQHELTERREKRDRQAKLDPDGYALEIAEVETTMTPASLLFPAVRWAESA